MQIELLEPNVIPKRTHLSHNSLNIIGIPRKFHNADINDFKTPDKALMRVRDFVSDYIKKLETKGRKDYLDGIFFYGSNGVGKTMLSSIILKVAYIYRYSCRRVTFANYVNSYTSSWSGEEDYLWESCKSSDFLALEEVGKEVDSKITKPILEDLLRYREEKGLVTIMCTNLTPDDLEEVYGASIISLIKGNMTPVKITGKDMR